MPSIKSSVGISRRIRSWTFDSDGGFAEATWTCKKDRWFIQNKGTLADGRKASMVNASQVVRIRSPGRRRADGRRRIAPNIMRCSSSG
jgi:hypothetical protein